MKETPLAVLLVLPHRERQDRAQCEGGRPDEVREAHQPALLDLVLVDLVEGAGDGGQGEGQQRSPRDSAVAAVVPDGDRLLAWRDRGSACRRRSD